jgi:hypothetical protein
MKPPNLVSYIPRAPKPRSTRPCLAFYQFNKWQRRLRANNHRPRATILPVHGLVDYADRFLIPFLKPNAKNIKDRVDLVIDLLAGHNCFRS